MRVVGFPETRGRSESEGRLRAAEGRSGFPLSERSKGGARAVPALRVDLASCGAAGARTLGPERW